MTRVSADLTPIEWGALDRWAEHHGVTRSYAVAEAVRRLTGAFDDEVLGASQMGALHPVMRATPRTTCHCDGPPHPYDRTWCKP